MAIIKSFEISAVYNSSETSKMSFTLASTDVCSDFVWNNACLREGEARPFSVRLHIERTENIGIGSVYPWKDWWNGIMYSHGAFPVTCNIRGSQNDSWKFLGNYTVYEDEFSPETYIKKPVEIWIGIDFDDGVSNQQKIQRFEISHF